MLFMWSVSQGFAAGLWSFAPLARRAGPRQRHNDSPAHGQRPGYRQSRNVPSPERAELDPTHRAKSTLQFPAFRLPVFLSIAMQSDKVSAKLNGLRTGMWAPLMTRKDHDSRMHGRNRIPVCAKPATQTENGAFSGTLERGVALAVRVGAGSSAARWTALTEAWIQNKHRAWVSAIFTVASSRGKPAASEKSWTKSGRGSRETGRPAR